MNIPIFLASDEKFVKYMSVTISSIINNTNEKIMFFVLDGGIEVKSKNKFYKMLDGTQHSIEFIKMDLSYFNQFPKIRHFSINTYFRYLIPDLKSEFNKVLYIDTDMVVCGDVKEIYENDLGNNGIGAVVYMDEECNPDLYRNYKKSLFIPANHGYFNAGLLLINCDYWRKNNIIRKLFTKTAQLKDKISMPDQDILNIIFEKYLNLSPAYNIVVDLTADYKNFSEYISKIKGCYILHYTGGRGVRPWLKYKVPGYKEFWKYAKKTPFYNALIKDLLNNELNKICSIKTIKKMLQNIFSIKNENIRKNITLLGIKFKIKSKRLMQRKMQKELNDKINSQILSMANLKNDYENKIAELREEIKYQNKTIFEQEQKYKDIYVNSSKNTHREILQNLQSELFNLYPELIYYRQYNDKININLSGIGVRADNEWDYVKILFPQIEFVNNSDIDNKNIDYYFAWGTQNYPTNFEMFKRAYLFNKPLYILEDGFLKSLDTWANKNAPEKYRRGVSFTIENKVPYYDARFPSGLELMLNDKNLIITEEQRNRARNCINKIIETHLTKYNHQPIYEPKIGREGYKKVLVVDQSYGDMSVIKGYANEETFKNMLDAAIKENPDADIILKIHPDTIAGVGGYYKNMMQHDNIYIMKEPINPISMIKYCDKIYVCTTQLGFEALMCGKEVHVFGMPFYAGWGLTIDRQKCKRRTNIRTVEDIFYIAYIMYSFYVNPDKQCKCEIEEAMDYLLKLREEYIETKFV